MSDYISRQAAIKEIDALHDKPNAWLEYAVDAIKHLPSAQPDLSDYSDKLWRKAYERGKAEAQAEIIRCKDCKYHGQSKYDQSENTYCFHHMMGGMHDDDFCSRAERRTDEPEK